jgi:chlorite dismutase
MAERILNLYTTYAFTDAFWDLAPAERASVRANIASSVQAVSEACHLYKVFPTRSDSDFLLWTAWGADAHEAAEKAFLAFAKAAEGWRQYARPTQSLMGFTKPSMYSRGKSEQDMDPFEGERTPYLIVYPFSKTKDWYLMSMDARQGMMNEHIKLGKQFVDIKQLLVYSFGLQDQEFVVAYETDDLPHFSDLVQQLRSTEGRRYTLLDTPLITGIHCTPGEFAQ